MDLPTCSGPHQHTNMGGNPGFSQGQQGAVIIWDNTGQSPKGNTHRRKQETMSDCPEGNKRWCWVHLECCDSVGTTPCPRGPAQPCGRISLHPFDPTPPFSLGGFFLLHLIFSSNSVAILRTGCRQRHGFLPGVSPQHVPKGSVVAQRASGVPSRRRR